MNSWFDPLPFTADPLWPWSIPTVGWILLLVVALLLVGLTIGTYFTVAGMRPGRLLALLCIRTVALLLIVFSLAGISYVSSAELKVPSLLLIGVDGSESMGAVQDEIEGQSRWNYLVRTLRDCQPILDKLREEHNITVLFFKFGDHVSEFDPANPGKADGTRTDTAQLLQTLHERYRSERYLRGLYLLSDGADNGASEPSPRTLAMQWRSLPCPVSTFTFGKETTSERQADIAVRSITPIPPSVPVKGKLTVRGTIDAPGFENSQVRVKLFLNDEEVTPLVVKINGSDVTDKPQVLKLREGNQVEIECNAPAKAPSKPSDIKVSLKVHAADRPEPLAGEMSAANNEMSTYVTITSEGIKVLVIDREGHFPELQMVVDALADDPRIRVNTLWLRGQDLQPAQKSLFQFERQKYDVIIIGDATAAQFRRADPNALAVIQDLVNTKDAGLLMIGGRYSFGNGDWRGTELERMLPVRLDVRGQVEGSVKLKPTAAGLNYLCLLSDNREDSKTLWSKLPDLEGRTRLGEPINNATVYLETITGEPVLVGREHGTGRVLASALDTTHLWVVDETGRKAHARFWKQVALWLAKKENSSGNLKIDPAIRRLPLGSELLFTTNLTGKAGEELKEVKYQVKMIDSRGSETPVPVTRKDNRTVGLFKPPTAGEYRIVAKATGKDADKNEITGDAEVRFVSYQDDAETTRRAADHEFLQSLADTGGGRRYRASELGRVLERLPSEPLPQAPPHAAKWPDWRSSKGRSPFLVAFLLLFVQLLALEWFLRRHWGMV